MCMNREHIFRVLSVDIYDTIIVGEINIFVDRVFVLFQQDFGNESQVSEDQLDGSSNFQVATERRRILEKVKRTEEKVHQENEKMQGE